MNSFTIMNHLLLSDILFYYDDSFNSSEYFKEFGSFGHNEWFIFMIHFWNLTVTYIMWFVLIVWIFWRVLLTYFLWMVKPLWFIWLLWIFLNIWFVLVSWMYLLVFGSYKWIEYLLLPWFIYLSRIVYLDRFDSFHTTE